MTDGPSDRTPGISAIEYVDDDGLVHRREVDGDEIRDRVVGHE